MNNKNILKSRKFRYGKHLRRYSNFRNSRNLPPLQRNYALSLRMCKTANDRTADNKGVIIMLCENWIWLPADKYPDRYAWFCNVDPRAYPNKKDGNLKNLINHYKS